MLLVEVAVKIISESESCSAMSNCLLPHGVYSPWNSPGQNTGMGTSRSLLQGIFPTQGSNPGLPHCRWILYQLSQKGSPCFSSHFASPFASLLLLLLLLSCFSRVQLCATPQMAAHQAPPSLGFPRQEYGSGLPFPSPMHESEK